MENGFHTCKPTSGDCVEVRKNIKGFRLHSWSQSRGACVQNKTDCVTGTHHPHGSPLSQSPLKMKSPFPDCKYLARGGNRIIRIQNQKVIGITFFCLTYFQIRNSFRVQKGKEGARTHDLWFTVQSSFFYTRLCQNQF